MPLSPPIMYIVIALTTYHLLSSPSLSTSAPPLKVDTVLTAVQGVNYRALGEKLLQHSIAEGKVFYPKLNEIELLYQSHDDRLRAVIECWMHGDGIDKKLSWRRIICALDDAEEMRIANNIRHHAEPVPGKS